MVSSGLQKKFTFIIYWCYLGKYYYTLYILQTQGEADEMRAEIKAIIKKTQPLRPNISREEQKALKELRKVNTRVILTADKGVCLVVMDKEEYIGKAELLKEETYKIIPTDPTNRQKNKLIQILKKIKEEGGVNEETHKKDVSNM